MVEAENLLLIAAEVASALNGTPIRPVTQVDIRKAVVEQPPAIVVPGALSKDEGLVTRRELAPGAKAQEKTIQELMAMSQPVPVDAIRVRQAGVAAESPLTPEYVLPTV